MLDRQSQWAAVHNSHSPPGVCSRPQGPLSPSSQLSVLPLGLGLQLGRVQPLPGSMFWAACAPCVLQGPVGGSRSAQGLRPGWLFAGGLHLTPLPTALNQGPRQGGPRPRSPRPNLPSDSLLACEVVGRLGHAQAHRHLHVWVQRGPRSVGGGRLQPALPGGAQGLPGTG